MSFLVAGRYRLRTRIGNGSFGETFCGEDMISKRGVAIKLESKSAQYPRLAHEYKIYLILKGAHGFPAVYWYGEYMDYYALVIDKLGESLDTVLKERQGSISEKSVVLIAIQAISRLEFFHRKGFIHRDVKPDNFLISDDPNSPILYLIDFGLSRMYRDSTTGIHNAYMDNKGFVGTARYASHNVHKGIEYSRRDDLESLAYCLIYLLKGSLPWQGIAADNQKDKFDLIGKTKLVFPDEELCSGVAEEFLTYLKRVRCLSYEEEPHYAEYRELFRNLLLRRGESEDGVYDWTKQRQEKEIFLPKLVNVKNFQSRPIMIDRRSSFNLARIKRPFSNSISSFGSPISMNKRVF